jgi:hypothetical protein
MATVMGVHGIAQQQTGPHQLAQQWRLALADGIQLALGSAVPAPSLEVAFYGHLFRPVAAPGAKGAPDSGRGEDPDLGLLDDVDNEERADLECAAGRAITVAGTAEPDAAESKGITRMPTWMQAVLRTLDRRFGPTAGLLYLGELRQVRRYLRDPAMKSGVDAVVARAVGPDCRILVGHSLGSVVAWEFVRQNPDHPLDLFVTLGSPLGLEVVRNALPVPGYGVDARPSHVARWVNIRDPHDPVACAGDLRQWWSGLEECLVNNEVEAHSVLRYLDSVEAGRAVLAATTRSAE